MPPAGQNTLFTNNQQFLCFGPHFVTNPSISVKIPAEIQFPTISQLTVRTAVLSLRTRFEPRSAFIVHYVVPCFSNMTVLYDVGHLARTVERLIQQQADLEPKLLT